eukprot:1764384-Rhodomonas_salina.1
MEAQGVLEDSQEGSLVGRQAQQPVTKLLYTVEEAQQQKDTVYLTYCYWFAAFNSIDMARLYLLLLETLGMTKADVDIIRLAHAGTWVQVRTPYGDTAKGLYTVLHNTMGRRREDACGEGLIDNGSHEVQDWAGKKSDHFVQDAIRARSARLTMYTDSMSTVYIVLRWTHWDFSPSLDQEEQDDIVEALLEVLRSRTGHTTLVWVRAHAGDPGNEMADCEAKA